MSAAQVEDLDVHRLGIEHEYQPGRLIHRQVGRFPHRTRAKVALECALARVVDLDRPPTQVADEDRLARRPHGERAALDLEAHSSLQRDRIDSYNHPESGI